MLIRAVAVCLLLAGCNTAGPGFRGAPSMTADAGKDSFVLRRADDVVEAIRTSPRPFPTFPEVAGNAAQAVARATGCRPAWVVGDPSRMTVGIACADRKAPKAPNIRPVLLCDVSDASYSWQTGRGSALLGCAPG